MLERREVLGGACVTEEVWPGYKVSTAAYVNSLLRPEIIRDLELKKHGFEMLPRSPSSFTPFPDGRSLMMGPDKAMTHREIAKFSTKDAEALPKYEAMLERVADFLEPTLTMTPPEPVVVPAGEPAAARPSSGSASASSAHDGQKAVEILTGAATPILDRWFESEQLKVTLATDAVIGAMASPSMPGTAYVLFHHVMGECNGVRGRVGLRPRRHGRDQQRDRRRPRGRTGRRSAPTRRWRRSWSGTAPCSGVALADGTEIRATAGRLRRGRQRHLPQADERTAICRPTSSTRSGTSTTPAPAEDQRRPERAARLHRDAGHRAGPAAPRHDPHLADHGLHRARLRRRQVRPSVAASDPRSTIPSVLDDTLAPPGKHVMSMFIQYFPYKLAPGLSLEAEKEKFADRCFDMMNEYAPNFKRSVIERQVLVAGRSGAALRPHRRQHHAGRRCRSAACRSCGRCRATPTTGRRSAACTCAARRPTRAAA